MISFSGIDCSGKSTQIVLLCDYLKKSGKKYKVVWSRGGYTPGINLIKKILRHGKNMSKEEIIDYSRKTNSNHFKRKVLFIAGLIDLWVYYSVVIRVYGVFNLVICDRYIWDTYIDYKLRYPDYKFENSFLWKIIIRTMEKPEPSFCLIIPAEESMRRSSLKDEPFPESLEQRMDRIRHYQKEIMNNKWDVVIDATQSVEEVFAEILNHLSGRT